VDAESAEAMAVEVSEEDLTHGDDEELHGDDGDFQDFDEDMFGDDEDLYSDDEDEDTSDDVRPIWDQCVITLFGDFLPIFSAHFCQYSAQIFANIQRKFCKFSAQIL
jgi:hypothetical protein